MPKRKDKYTREDGRPTFTFWRELRKLMKRLHESVEAAKESQKERDRERLEGEIALQRAKDAVARVALSR